MNPPEILKLDQPWISVNSPTKPSEHELVLVSGLDFGTGPYRHYMVAEYLQGSFLEKKYNETNYDNEYCDASDYIDFWMKIPGVEILPKTEKEKHLEALRRGRKCPLCWGETLTYRHPHALIKCRDCGYILHQEGDTAPYVYKEQ